LTWVAQFQRQGFSGVSGGRLPSDLSYFFVGRLALVFQDAVSFSRSLRRRLPL